MLTSTVHQAKGGYLEPNGMSTTASGNRAEQAVADLLKSKGYKVIELNWKTPYAEIDIVAQRSNTLYFVEVKYRGTSQAGDGFDYITPNKLHHMRRAAEGYVLASEWPGEYILMAASAMGSIDDLTIELVEI